MHVSALRIMRAIEAASPRFDRVTVLRDTADSDDGDVEVDAIQYGVVRMDWRADGDLRAESDVAAEHIQIADRMRGNLKWDAEASGGDREVPAVT